MTRSKDSVDKSINRVLLAIEAIKAGNMVIMTDDEDRENEGDLVFAAQDVTPGKVNFMISKARGLVCLALETADVERLGLPMMMESTSKNMASMRTAFTVSIEAKSGVTTGISAADRAHTIRTAIDPNNCANDIVVPGHIFPLKARPGGVLERVGHTEGSVDLARLAGKKAAAVICEIMNDDGTMARMPDLEKFSAQHQIPIVSIADLVTYRLSKDTLVEEICSRPLITDGGTYQGIWFKTSLDHLIHFALVKGAPFDDQIVDVRVQKQHGIYDVFACEHQVSAHPSRSGIAYGLKMLASSERAAVIYLANNQEEILSPLDSPKQMDPRTYGIGAQILKKLGVSKMCLHVSSEKNLVAAKGFGLDIVETRFIQ